jgi:hypothetical protein
LLAEANKLSAIHIADNDGVTFKRVPPKSFVQPRKMKTEAFNYSRLARTPPSTFLFLHLYLSNSPGSEEPVSQLWEFFPFLGVLKNSLDDK